MAGAASKAVRLVISGRVQGVWYRGWAVETARALNLAGWVCNRNDGCVEALIAGPAEPVDRMVTACRQGPPGANVTGVEVTPANADDAPSPFEQRDTG